MPTTKRKRRPSLRRKELTVDDIKEVVGRTWFDVDHEGDRIMLCTRDNGDVGEEEPGRLDIEEGQRLLKEIRKRCPFDTRKSGIECVDEWVHVEVFIEPRSKKEIAERKKDAEIRALEKRINDYVQQANAELLEEKGIEDGKVRATLVPTGGLSVTVRFGERYLYHNHLGSGFMLKTVEEGRKLLEKIPKKFPELSWREYEPIGGRPTWELKECVTYNYSPPRAIEKEGTVELRGELKD